MICGEDLYVTGRQEEIAENWNDKLRPRGPSDYNIESLMQTSGTDLPYTECIENILTIRFNN